MADVQTDLTALRDRLVHAAKAYTLADYCGHVEALDTLEAATQKLILSALEFAEGSFAAADAAALGSLPVPDTDLRRAWDDGIKTAIGYGDNVGHLRGKQADRHFASFLTEAALLSRSAQEPPKEPKC